ncbi:MAG: putative Ig domain-containing protein [Pseudomonadota bacterium]
MNNAAPTITATLVLTVTQDQPYSLVPTASDVDGDALTFAISNKPGWASFNADDGALTGVPGNDDVGTYDGIVISVSDGEARATLPTFSISVINVNDAPTIAGSPSQFVESGDFYRFTQTAVDPDGEFVGLTIRNKPAWATFNAQTGELSGTPGSADVGTFEGILIGINDGEFSDFLPPFSLTVTDFSGVDWLRDTPLLPLLGTVNLQSSAERNISNDELDALALNYVGVHGAPNLLPLSETLDTLRSLNPDFIALPYLNSSQSDMGVAEANRFEMINVYHEAVLDRSIDATETTLPLTPADAERGWGLKASTVAGSLSQSSSEYVAYVRLRDELMRIEAVDEAAGTITVTRGFDGTTPRAHGAGERVLAPVYVAVPEPVGNGNSLWRIPDNEDGLPLRYSLQVGTAAVASYLSGEIVQQARNGANGAWLDICSPNFFFPGNAFGDPVVPWNLETGAQFTAVQRKDHQERKLDRLQTALEAATGRLPVLKANNLGGGSYFQSGGGGMDYVFSTVTKPTPIDGVIVEQAFSLGFRNEFRSYSSWLTNLETLAHGAQNGAPVLPWIKSVVADYRPNSAVAERFELFDYATILLAWENNTGASIPLPLFAEAAEGGRRLNLSPWLFYELGEPESHAPYDDVEQLRIAGTNTFARRWTNGIVLVNPSAEDDAAVPLPATYIEPTTQDRVVAIDMPAQTGALLILD